VDELPVAPLDELRRRRSAKWRRYPQDVLPLPVAETDFALAPCVRDALREAVERSDTGYAMAMGVLGPAFSSFAAARWDWRVDPDRVTSVADVGVGAIELLRVLGPGRPVVVNPPVYAPFYHWVHDSGTSLVEVPLVAGPDGYRLDLAGLERAFAAGAAAYLLCNPHNPVGRAHTRDELVAVVDLARRYGVLIVSDEIHAPLVLPGARFTPVLDLPGAPGIAVALHSASKAFNLAGLKCAVIVTADPAMDAFVARLPEDTPWRIGHFGVLASVAAFTEGHAWLDRLVHTLDRRRARLGELLSERLPDVTWVPPEATYLAWLDCTALGRGEEPWRLFLDRGKVALEPGPRFGAGGSGFVRFNFATGDDVLDRATAAMAEAVSRAADPV
jgi:cysteine-S-conjugate beta-lyase